MPIRRGSNHPSWKGDDANTGTKRARAQRMFALTICERCGEADARDRHHRDGNTGNNCRKNIAILCRRCHMIEDGRLLKLKKLAKHNSEVRRKPPRPCRTCNRVATQFWRGECHRCNEYRRRNGKPRPLNFIAYPRIDCPNCGRTNQRRVGRICRYCYRAAWMRAYRERIRIRRGQRAC